jgi:AcrR family transcriptional regulator
MGNRKQAQDPLLRKILGSGIEPGEPASERILEAAVVHAEEFGMRRFTIGDVARRAGLSRVTIYNYFPGKDRLIEAVLLRELRRFLREIDEAVAPYETLEQRLVEGFVFGLTYLRRHRLLNRLLRTEPELLLPYLTVKGSPVLAAGREFIAGFARREAEQGGLPLGEAEIEGVSELLARAVLSFVLTPDSVLGLKTQAEIRRFAEHYLGPTLQAIAALPQPAGKARTAA